MFEWWYPGLESYSRSFSLIKLLIKKLLFPQAIDIFMSSCTVFVFLSLIEYAFVNVMLGDISDVERKDKTAHIRSVIISKTSNTDLCIDQKVNNFAERKVKKTQKKEPKEIMKKRREKAICIDRVSRVIFPSTFILLNIIYWLVFSEILKAIKSTA